MPRDDYYDDLWKNLETPGYMHEFLSNNNPFVLALFTRAARMTFTRDGAPKSCPNKTCRKSGQCHIILRHKAPNCTSSVGISQSAADEIKAILLYLIDIGSNPPEIDYGRRE